MTNLTPYLPKLREPKQGEPGIDLSLPTTPGNWDEKQDDRRISMLADAIEVPPGADSVHSIPDPWARAVLFWRALTDSDHTLHDRVLGEWQGLLGLMAMRYVSNFHQLDGAQLIELGAQGAGEEEEEEDFNRPFSSVLARLLPGKSDAITQTAGWDRFHILCWTGDRTNGRPRAFAMTSPLTLVATGADYSQVLSTKEIPWFVDGRLTNPKNFIHKDHRALLGDWLLHVKAGVPTGDGTKSKDISQLLINFAAELGRSQKTLRPRSDVFSDHSLGLVGVDLYKGINIPCAAPAEVMTNCALKAKVDGPPYLIVIDKPGTPAHLRIPTQLGMLGQDVIVHHTLTAARVDREVQDRSGRGHGHFDAKKEDGIPGAQWCTADYFFERDLIFERNVPLGGAAASDAFPGCRGIRTEGNADYCYFALPIREQVLDWLTPEYLIENLSMVWLPSGDAKFELSLTLDTLLLVDRMAEAPATDSNPEADQALENDANGNVTQKPQGQNRDKRIVWEGKPRTIKLERTYLRDNRVRVNLLPAVCLWPDFRFEDETQTRTEGAVTTLTVNNRWKSYYLFESWQIGSDTNQLLVYAHGERNAEKRLTKLKYTGEEGEREDSFQVTRLKRYPDVLICTMPPNKSRAATRFDGLPSGLLIIDVPSSLTAMNTGKRVLGVDFGTTGTTIYVMKQGDSSEKTEGEPERLEFKNRLKQITDLDAGQYRLLTRAQFLPNAQPAFGRILTVFQDFGAQSQPKPVLDGHVLFLENAGLKQFVQGDPKLVRTKLKWGDDPVDDIAARNFLSQLCLQSLAELVAMGSSEVQLRYSYPTAFSDSRRKDFQRKWSGVLSEMQSSTSVRVSSDMKNIDQYSEAICATQFFSHSINRATMDPGVGGITLDIGGGTTDIAIWNQHPVSRDPALMAHTSITFAGQDIFLAPLRRRPDLLSLIDNGGPVTAAINNLHQRFKQNETENAYFAELDAIVSSYSDQVLKQLPYYGESPGVKDLLSLLEFGLCGISFYSGLILGSLVEDASYTCEGKSLVPVYVGGNGSRLFNWCERGVSLEDSELIRRFSSSLLAGASYALGAEFPIQRVDVSLSVRPKEEVAFGLVRDPAQIMVNHKYVHRIVGEQYRVGPSADLKLRSWNEPLDEKTLANEPVDVDPQMPVFRHFLKSIDEEADDKEIQRACTAINEKLRKKKAEAAAALHVKTTDGQDRDSIRQEPLFILALDSYVALRVSQIAAMPLEAKK